MRKLILSWLMAYSLSYSLLEAGVVILVDTSGSMSGQEQALSEAINWLTERVRNYRVYSFGCGIKELENETIQTGCGTPMAHALHKAQEVGKEVVFLLSDGVPDSITDTNQAAQNLRQSGVKLCSIYVGDKSDGGAVLLKSLSDEFTTIGMLNNTSFAYCLHKARQMQWAIEVAEENLTKTLPSMRNDVLDGVIQENLKGGVR